MMWLAFNQHKNFLTKTSKYLFSVLLGICLLLLGCQTQSGESNVTRLTFWHGVNPPSNRDVLQVLVDKFNQTHPDIFVESLYVGQQDQQMPKILAAVVGNAPPDMLWYNPTITGQLVELGAIRSLDDLLAKSAIAKQINPALLETMQLRDKSWSVPFDTNNVGVFYRPSLFKAAGIKNLPKTWDQLRQVAKQLTADTNNDGRIDRHGILLSLGKGEWTVFTWLPFMWSSGGELGSKGLDIGNNGAIAALNFWRTLIDDGSATLSLPERGYEIDGFLAGKVAMQITGPWTLGQFKDSKVDYAVFPIPADDRPATSLGGENLYIFKTNPKREQAAFKFGEYVLSQEFQTEWALKTGYLPVNIKSSKSAAYQKFAGETPGVKVFLEQAKVARSRPIIPGYNRISENLGRAIEAVLLGKSSPTEALKQSEQRLDLIFQ